MWALAILGRSDMLDFGNLQKTLDILSVFWIVCAVHAVAICALIIVAACGRRRWALQVYVALIAALASDILSCYVILATGFTMAGM